MKLSRRVGRGIKIGLVIIFGFVVLLGTALHYPQQVLTVDSGPVNADALVVLGGGLDRPQRAAELFKAGEAPLVICSGLGDCESVQLLLMQGGVPRPVIQLECDSRNTSENARLTIKLLRQLRAKRVIIVTSWYHSRRALNCFEHYAPDLAFYSRPSYDAGKGADTNPQRIASKIRMEYLKNLGYLIRYGVSPF